MENGFFRVTAATSMIRVVNCQHNGSATADLVHEVKQRQVGTAVFPELCLTGYTCDDLFRDGILIVGAEMTLSRVLRETRDMRIIAVIDVPVALSAKLYSTATVVHQGRIPGLAIKRSIPDYSEFYGARHFSPVSTIRGIPFCGQVVPIGGDLVLRCLSIPELILDVGICEDLWMPTPSSTSLASCGVTVTSNPSASGEVVGKPSYRRALITGQSARLITAYAYADAGEGEFSTGMVFSGHNPIAENGIFLTEVPLFTTGLTCVGIGLQRLIQERRRVITRQSDCYCTTIPFDLILTPLELRRTLPCLPFIPSDSSGLYDRCELILTMQAEKLKTRLCHTGGKPAMIGLSGGLDSTLVLLVTVCASDSLHLPCTRITAASMPGFGTISRTKNNASGLTGSLGASFRETSIAAVAEQHSKNIGYDPQVHDVAYENLQAREHMQIPMDVADQTGGIVTGTGDPSELVLGRAICNGDHISMYGVGASIPKTLVYYPVRHAVENSQSGVRELLLDILSIPVSPELLPPVDDEISQKTEDLVGPYELHDFLLFYMLRFDSRPKKIYRMARMAFTGAYDDETIKKWPLVFYRRFFAQQFKRSCLSDGPKVSTVTLSPRGNFHMSSDASSRLWLGEVESL